MKQVDLASMTEIIKVGDTVADMKAGLHAGGTSIGVIVGSSEMGLSEEEYFALSESKQNELIEKTKSEFEEAGAHYTIHTMAELMGLIEKLSNEAKILL